MVITEIVNKDLSGVENGRIARVYVVTAFLVRICILHVGSITFQK